MNQAPKQKSPVRVREKALNNGCTSLYLDINHNGRRRYEFLRLYLTPEHNKRDRERNRTTMLQAEAAAARRVLELQNGTFGRVFDIRNALTLADQLRALAKRNGIKDKSGYNCAASRVEAYGDIQLTRCTPEYLRGFAAYLNGCTCTDQSKNGSTDKRNGRPLAQGTQFHLFGKVVFALQDAVRKSIIPSNPSQALTSKEKPHKPQPRPRYLTEAQVRQLIDTKYRADTKRPFLFACFVGLRVSDLRALCWRDIEHTPNGLQVRRTQNKTKREVVIPISANAAKWLPEKPKGAAPTARVFANLPTKSTLQRYVTEWGKLAGIERLTFHQSRHTCATLLISAGADLYTTSKILGHASIQNTQIYAQVLDEKKREAVQLLPDF